jgi:hypothetical protein
LNNDILQQHRPQPRIDQEIQRTLEAELTREEWLAKLELVEPPRFDRTVDNFDNRALRQSLSVIPIAVAVAMAIQRSQRAAARLPDGEAAHLPRDIGGPQISVADFLVHPELAIGAVAEARELEEVMSHPPVPQPRRGIPKVQLRLE